MTGAELDRRESRRDAVMFSATIDHASAIGDVRVRNLSENGALVEALELPREGATLLFGRNGQLLPSHVVWADGRRGGIRFEEPLDVQSSLRHIQSPRRVPAARARRPGLTCKPLTEADKRMLERWATMGLRALGD